MLKICNAFENNHKQSKKTNDRMGKISTIYIALIYKDAPYKSVRNYQQPNRKSCKCPPREFTKGK